MKKTIILNINHNSLEKAMRGKLLILFAIIFINLFAVVSSFAQTPGLIYKPSSTSFGRSVLNPSGSGYASANPLGFQSGIDYGTESELQMIPVPFLSLEPSNDLATGSPGGHTDIVRNTNDNTQSQSVYVLVRNVGGVDYLIVRFRIGKASTASKGYSLLMDANGTFSGSGANPGFEYEVVLETGFRVAVYNHTNATSQSFDINEYSQRSISASTVDGHPDYFYDFFIPLSALPNEPIRFAAVTVTSAQSGINGTISDVNGVDDKKYANNVSAMLKAMINSFPPTYLSSLTTGGSFNPPITSAPAISSQVRVSSTSISGTSQEANGTSITVYQNGVSIGSTTVSNNTWTLNGVSGLVLGDVMTARATASGKSQSVLSNEVIVTADAFCYTPGPVITARNNGSQLVSGTWAPVSGSITANTVRIRMYNQTGENTFTEILSKDAEPTRYVQTDGSWSFSLNVTQPQMNPMFLFATAEVNGCVSRLSNGSAGNTGTLASAPTVNTSPILASTGSTTVNVTNNNSAASHLILYINGHEVSRTVSAVANGGSHNFSYSGFVAGDRVTARAQVPWGTNLWLSNLSNTVIVTSVAPQTAAPVISGQYIAGAGITVSGISTEEPGTTIRLYNNGSTLLGTTTVDAFGVWQVTGLTLSSGNILTATAEAIGKTLSNASASVTVAASAPSAPTVSGSYQAGATSISGTGGQGTITVYVDDSPIGTTTGASWTLSDIAPNQLYKGAVITATNTVSGIVSNLSNSITVTGVNSFRITAPNDSPVADQTAGIDFDIKVTARDGEDGNGNLVNTFTGTVVVSSTSIVSTGGGLTDGFTGGTLTPHNMTLITAGANHEIFVVSTDDPTAVGIAELDVFAGAPSTVTSTISANPTTILADGIESSSITVQLFDAYENEISSGGATVVINSSVGNVSSVTDNGNGSYSATLTSNTSGLATVSGTINGDQMANNVQVTLESEFPAYYSIKTGVWTDAESWSTVGHNGPPADNPPGEGDVCYIASNDTIWVNTNIANDAEIIVNNTGTLMTDDKVLSGEGDFTLNAGGTLGLASPQGIEGNIQVEGEIYIDDNSNLVFYYNGNQNVGNGVPITINNLEVVGGATKVMISDVTINGDFIMDAGFLSIGDNNLTINGPTTILNGRFSGSSNSNLTFTGTSSLDGALMFDNSSDESRSLYNFTTEIDITLGSRLHVMNDMTIDGSDFYIGPNQLRLYGDLNLVTNGNLIGSNQSRLWIDGPTAETMTLPAIDLNILEVYRQSGIVLTGVVNINTRIVLGEGVIENSSNVTGNDRTRITIINGSFDEFHSIANPELNYYGDAERETGFEIPENFRVFRFIVYNSTGVKLNSNLIMLASIVLENGYLDINGHEILLDTKDAILRENNNNFVIGISGQIVIKRILNNVEQSDWHNIGLAITTSAKLNTTEIIRGFSQYTISGEESIRRYYEIKPGSPNNNKNLNSTLVFRYNEKDIEGTVENTLQLYSRNTPINGSGNGWTLMPNQVLNTTNKTITVTGVQSIPRYITARGEPDGDNPGMGNMPGGELITEEIPDEYGLSQNYPNPFNPTTTIKYQMPENGNVSLKVFDITGREVMNLVNEMKSAGYHTTQFNGNNLASGVYFYRLDIRGETQEFSRIMRMMLIK